MSGVAPTPLMQQYREIKARHQSAILFFRMGDFYEMFYETPKRHRVCWVSRSPRATTAEPRKYHSPASQ